MKIYISSSNYCRSDHDLRLTLSFKQLVNIKCGPGAAILPAEVTRIHMDFAIRLKGGHMGARFVLFASLTITRKTRTSNAKATQ